MASQLKQAELKKASRVILALDLEDRKEAVKTALGVADYIDAVKIGYPLVLSCGIGIIGEIKKALAKSGKAKPIIADFKVADIPEISAMICKKAVESGADFVIVHGFGGEDVAEACSAAARIFMVCDMSHEGSRSFLEPSSMRIARIAKKYAYGIVAPATREKSIKKLRRIIGDLVIISPGVKAQGAAPGSAILAGADFEIVGRGIYNAKDRKKAAQEILSEIKQKMRTKEGEHGRGKKQ